MTTNTAEHSALEWPGTLVETAWLAAHLGHPALQVIDIRGAVKPGVDEAGQPRSLYLAARDEYEAGHIPGAVFVDWTVDIVDPDDPVPAQLAPPDRFAALLGSLGIGDEAAVVIYDQRGALFATRLWWALTYYGHERVAILNGGWAKWQVEGREVSTVVPAPEPATFTPKAGRIGRKTGQEVLEHVELRDAVIVDVLSREQYTGAATRGSAPGGHIPGATHLPATSLFTAEGTWKPDEELQELVTAAGLEDDGRPVVAYCNGGVTATAVLFALDRLGRSGHNYDGSWNEWGNNPRFPVRQGEEP